MGEPIKIRLENISINKYWKQAVEYLPVICGWLIILCENRLCFILVKTPWRFFLALFQLYLFYQKHGDESDDEKHSSSTQTETKREVSRQLEIYFNTETTWKPIETFINNTWFVFDWNKYLYIWNGIENSIFWTRKCVLRGVIFPQST